MARANRARSKAYKPALELIAGFASTGPSSPTPRRPGRRRCFPDDPEERAVAKLWDAIFAASRVDAPDPVAAWQAHNDEPASARAASEREALSRALHFRGPGTDLQGRACRRSCLGGRRDVRRRTAIVCNPNIPTEEVFTTPHADRVDGMVTSTKPLSYQGTLIEESPCASRAGGSWKRRRGPGEEVLSKVLETDEGARRLGEVALVPIRRRSRRAGCSSTTRCSTRTRRATSLSARPTASASGTAAR